MPGTLSGSILRLDKNLPAAIKCRWRFRNCRRRCVSAPEPAAPPPSPTRRTIRRTPARCTSGGFCRRSRGCDAFTRWASSIAISVSTISSFRATPLPDCSSAISRAGGGTISRPKSARNPSSVPGGMISAPPSKAKLFILGLKAEFFVGRPSTLGLKPLCLADAIRTFHATP